MGGYAGYVWSAYGLVSVVFLFQLVSTKWRQKRTRDLLRQWLKSMPQ
ncbi:MAG: heme exporter protein CcmD [Legionellales bacterium]|nr:heme exporter protein CcmD [Legionellales bacterium]